MNTITEDHPVAYTETRISLLIPANWFLFYVMVLEAINFQVDFLKLKTCNPFIRYLLLSALYIFVIHGLNSCKNNLFFGEDKLISSQVKSILYIYFLCVKNRTICQLWIPIFDFPALVQRFVSEIEKMILLLTCFIKSSRLNAYVKRPITVFHLVTRKFTLLTQIDFQTLLRRLVSEMRWKW